MLASRRDPSITIFSKPSATISTCEQFLVSGLTARQKKNVLPSFPGTTRPARPGEINGQDYTFLSTKDFRALEKSGNLLESGVYKGKSCFFLFCSLPSNSLHFSIRTLFFFFFFFLMKTGHYYGTPRPPKEALLTNGQHPYPSQMSNNPLLRRSNSANEMFQQQRFSDNGVDQNGKARRILL